MWFGGGNKGSKRFNLHLVLDVGLNFLLFRKLQQSSNSLITLVLAEVVGIPVDESSLSLTRSVLNEFVILTTTHMNNFSIRITSQYNDSPACNGWGSNASYTAQSAILMYYIWFTAPPALAKVDFCCCCCCFLNLLCILFSTNLLFPFLTQISLSLQRIGQMFLPKKATPPPQLCVTSHFTHSAGYISCGVSLRYYLYCYFISVLHYKFLEIKNYVSFFYINQCNKYLVLC